MYGRVSFESVFIDIPFRVEVNFLFPRFFTLLAVYVSLIELLFIGYNIILFFEEIEHTVLDSLGLFLSFDVVRNLRQADVFDERKYKQSIFEQLFAY